MGGPHGDSIGALNSSAQLTAVTARKQDDVTQYAIYFNQQWVGEHSEEWFASRGPLARAVVAEMRAAGVCVFAGGLEEELEAAFAADNTSGSLIISDGPVTQRSEWLGGLTIIDVADDNAAKYWAGRVAEACGWPQETRRFKG